MVRNHVDSMSRSWLVAWHEKGAQYLRQAAYVAYSGKLFCSVFIYICCIKMFI